MDPQIQYCKTSDGVSIAYYAMGDGPPRVVASTVVGGHLLLLRAIPRIGTNMEAQERRHRVIRYDGRGSGLSQREVPDFTLASRVLDLEGVIDHLQLERFALTGHRHGGLTAVAYAVQHPERVSHLILDNAYACGRDRHDGSPALQAFEAMRPLMEDQWESYSLAAANWELGFSDGEKAKELAALYRGAMEPAALLAFRQATVQIDVTNLLSEVRVPTLVICRGDQAFAQPRLSQVVASRIPNARLAVLEPWTGRGVDEQWLRAIEEFLGDAPRAHDAGDTLGAAPPREATTSFRTILFTDIVGHTPMMQRLGDDTGRAVLREHERITRDVLKQHAGAEVKTDGDSFMASFTSATRAVECAVALQRAFAAHNETSAEPILIRAGLNIGEPIEENGDFFGSAVILSARIKDQAGGGEILVPEAVRHLLSGKSFAFADRGAVVLKGFEDAVRLYEVRWRQA